LYKWYHNTYCTKLNNPQHVIFSVPNGGHRSKSEAAKFKATGLVAGVSDLIIIQPNRIIFIELKLEKGKQQKTQLDFENKVKVLGFEYYVVRSLEEFKIVLVY
tara:strand:- start:1905 stop:2213 length:309 start_codon:yes stop_codon:yes gene_type:complete